MKRLDRITAKCKICKTKFEKTHKETKKYCSPKCYHKARKEGVYEPYWLGKKRSKETVKKQRETLKRLYQEGVLEVWCRGKKLSREHRKKLSQAKTNKYIGSRHPKWKGGKKLDEKGYIRVWVGVKKWRYEHRLVMERHLGRKLKKSEVVHHIDRNGSNNRIDNLMLFPNNSAHIHYHNKVLKDKTINQYGEY